ncbi:MAG: MBL fold metallo-hydrolase [Parachlamydiaceae bacterium]
MGKILFLGTGSSLGIPVIGCQCATCQSLSPLNKRLRSSVLLSSQGKRLLIDASPDLREQALRYKISKIDGVIFTHAHYDHTAGIDDLRIFHFINKKPLPCLVSTETAEELTKRYEYMFAPQPFEHQNASRLQLVHLSGDRGESVFETIPLSYFSFEQLSMKINGFRFGHLAYVTDIKNYPETIFEDLKGVEILIVSALRFTASPMHLNIDEAIDFSKKVGAKKTWFIHIAHEVEHEKMRSYLPDGIELAFDGLEINF